MNIALKEKLDVVTDLQKNLFEKGYLITTDKLGDTEQYPMYGNWNCTLLHKFYFWVYKTVSFTVFNKEKNTFFIIGHAYNPYTMEINEEKILQKIAEVYGTKEYFEAINELTGIFIMGVVNPDGIEFLLDASGMQYGCYGTINGEQYITSHMRLVGDLCGLQETEYVKELVSYRWYHFMMGNYMPGDITCYKELKRIVPNTYIRYLNGKYNVERFYPNKDIEICKNEAEYQKVIEESAKIMQNTMKLISQKWENPAISLTGGIDSNTTFAAANGLYDKYCTFSYVSMHRESVDAEKAKEISKKFGVNYTEYKIPDDNSEIENFELYKAIFEWNGGGIGNYKENDVRKKVTLIQNDVCDVEVKSWISETIRAYAYKYFGRTKFPKNLSARNYTSLYKIFFMNRKLVKQTDSYFSEYFVNTDLKNHLFNYDESDFFVWEMMHGGKCGLDIGVMKSCFDITIPYNNRKFLDTLLRVPLSYRISDRHHLDLKRLMNKELYDMNIRVINLNETDKRKKMANIYYTVNSKIPF